MPKNLPQNGHDFVEHLANFEPPPESIWLIGSRANGRANSSSDTDLLVFGSPELLQALSDAQLVPTDIDCLIVFDRNNYTDPFRIKSGSLSNLKWKSINQSKSGSLRRHQVATGRGV